jgi:hypothetical protein
MIERFCECFPNLKSEDCLVKRQESIEYNCLAWAIGVTREWWSPADPHYWPEGLPKENTLESFKCLFEGFGYQECERGDHAPGYEKVAIYVNETGVSHVSKQLESGSWTSKIGAEAVIEHPFRGLDGGIYGSIVLVMRRPVRRVEPSQIIQCLIKLL